MTMNPAPRSLTRATVTAWLLRFAATVRAVEPELTALDQQAGDGDFGANLATGMDGVRRDLDSLSASPAVGEDTAEAPLAVAARVFLDEVGGTSGPLFGLLFQEMADAVAEAAPTPPGTGELAAGIAAGTAAIQRVGEAEVGDKTMVDALIPAAKALADCSPTAEPARSLRLAAVAAHRGARATAYLRARRGRASYTGDHAVGVPDPGALAVALLFASADGELTTVSRLPEHRGAEY